jgi:hypothetical protein
MSRTRFNIEPMSRGWWCPQNPDWVSEEDDGLDRTGYLTRAYSEEYPRLTEDEEKRLDALMKSIPKIFTIDIRCFHDIYKAGYASEDILIRIRNWIDAQEELKRIQECSDAIAKAKVIDGPPDPRAEKKEDVI